MGNATSCTPSIILSSTACSAPPPTLKVVSFDGTLRLYMDPVRVAELMVENPGQFVCDPTTLQVSHRITGLPADDELFPSNDNNHHRLQSVGRLCNNTNYFLLLPMEMLYSTLTEEEMNWLTCLGSKATHNSNNNKYGGVISRILFPAAVSFSDYFVCMAAASNKNMVDLVDHDNYSTAEDGQQVNEVEFGSNLGNGKSYSRQRSWRPALETIVEAS